MKLSNISMCIVSVSEYLSDNLDIERKCRPLSVRCNKVHRFSRCYKSRQHCLRLHIVSIFTLEAYVLNMRRGLTTLSVYNIKIPSGSCRGCHVSAAQRSFSNLIYRKSNPKTSLSEALTMRTVWPMRASNKYL